MAAFDLPRRLTAEALGTALLLATVVGAVLATALFGWLLSPAPRVGIDGEAAADTGLAE